jgi:hypothetical protein
MKEVKLSLLFSQAELEILSNLINQKDFIKIREFLNKEQISKNIKEKGVLPDYLYYFLEYNFNKIKIV